MLEIWDADRIEHVLAGGRTRPVVASCVLRGSPSRARAEFVVKSLGAQLSHAGMANEIIGNLLARELGVATPRPVLVELSPGLCRAANQDLRSEGAQLVPGLAVAAEYLRGLAPVTPATTIPKDYVLDAGCLFAFDLIAQNPDRRPDKPNCALHHRRLVGFDFELCFSFLLLIGSVADHAWEVSKLDIARRHIMAQCLKRTSQDWISPVLEALAALSPDRLDEILAAPPAGWQPGVARIREHVLTIREHAADLREELVASLP